MPIFKGVWGLWLHYYCISEERRSIDFSDDDNIILLFLSLCFPSVVFLSPSPNYSSLFNLVPSALNPCLSFTFHPSPILTTTTTPTPDPDCRTPFRQQPDNDDNETGLHAHREADPFHPRRIPCRLFLCPHRIRLLHLRCNAMWYERLFEIVRNYKGSFMRVYIHSLC